jgi:hypothetical protein
MYNVMARAKLTIEEKFNFWPFRQLNFQAQTLLAEIAISDFSVSWILTVASLVILNAQAVCGWTRSNHEKWASWIRGAPARRVNKCTVFAAHILFACAHGNHCTRSGWCKTERCSSSTVFAACGARAGKALRALCNCWY